MFKRSEEELAAKRLQRLKQELEDEQVPLILQDNPVPGNFPNRNDVQDVLLDEIVYARRPPVHEGRRAPYGSIVARDQEAWGSLASAYEVGALDVVGGTGSPSPGHVRSLANGRSVWTLRTSAGTESLVHISLVTESALVEFVQETRCPVVQRMANGVVKVYIEDRVLSCAAESWSVKPFASSRTFELLHLLGLSGGRYFQVASDLLNFCLHVLGSRGIGATLVWFPQGVPDEVGSALAAPGVSTPVPLRVQAAFEQEVLAALLEGTDGATIVSDSGVIERVAVHLSSSAKSREVLPAEAGTRHTSGKRFSFDIPTSVCLVVSQDGPVTVYSDGMPLLHLRALGTYSQSLKKMVPEKGPDIDDHYAEVQCPKCDKRLVIEITVILGWKERESVDCPVCGAADIYSKMCFAMRALPLKPWDSDVRRITWGLDPSGPPTERL